MPFPLHKSPLGLLDLFRLRTLGNNPPQFGEAVTPVVEVAEFYAAENKLASSASPAVGGIGGSGATSTLTLTGRTRIHAFTAQLIVGAAAATNVTLTVRLLQGTTLACGASRFFAAVNAGALVTADLQLPLPIILPGVGWSVLATASGTAAGVDHQVRPTILIDNITAQGP